MSNEFEDDPAIPVGRVSIPTGIPNVELVHLATWEADNGMPFDGYWSVTLASSDAGMQRMPFRTLHAAANYAHRIRDLADWTGDVKALLQSAEGQVLSRAMLHAEAHAREIDATWPAGAWIPFDNGPSILDDDGVTRLFLGHAPTIDWKKDDEGAHRCAECGADPVVVFDWMDR